MDEDAPGIYEATKDGILNQVMPMINAPDLMIMPMATGMASPMVVTTATIAWEYPAPVRMAVSNGPIWSKYLLPMIVSPVMGCQVDST